MPLRSIAYPQQERSRSASPHLPPRPRTPTDDSAIATSAMTASTSSATQAVGTRKTRPIDTMASSSSTDFRMNPDDLAMLRQLPGNDRCIDCDKRFPEWASVSLGIFVCLDCSGRHRGLGTHISFVRSVTMDSWTDAQIQKMKLGGNQQCRAFLASYDIDTQPVPNAAMVSGKIRGKYDSAPAELYRRVLTARCKGEPEPTQLPAVVKATPKVNRPMVGFGSAPPPRKEKRTFKRNVAVAAAASVAVATAVKIFMR